MNYLGAALANQLPVKTVKCGCSRRYRPSEFARLKQLGPLEVEGGGTLLLANCDDCGSTLAMEVE